MVAWYWIPVALFFGVLIGMVVMGICAAAGISSREEEQIILNDGNRIQDLELRG